VVWVTGCTRMCHGCISPELQPLGPSRPVETLATELADSVAVADGLTISGGEPFDQAEALCLLLDTLRETTEVEVLVYSGYTLEQLQSGTREQLELLERIDVLIDGPFLIGDPNTLQWRGSDNQRMQLLSTHARTTYAGTEAMLWPERRPLDIQVLSGGIVRVVGIPRRADLVFPK